MSAQHNKKFPSGFVMVTVSALALSALTLPMKQALAVLNVQCLPGNKLDFGEHIVCGNGNLRVDADGGTNVAGCLVELRAPQPGTCTISDNTATRSITVSFTANTINGTNGTTQAVMRDFRIRNTTGGSSAAKLSFTSGEVNATVRVNVGGRILFSPGQPAGAYTGNVTMNVVFK